MIDPSMLRHPLRTAAAAAAALSLAGCVTEQVSEEVFRLEDPSGSSLAYGRLTVGYHRPDADDGGAIRVLVDGLPVIETWTSGDPQVTHSEYMQVSNATTTSKVFPLGIHTFGFEDLDGNFIGEVGPLEIVDRQELAIAVFGTAGDASINVFPTHFLEPFPQEVNVTIVNMRFDESPIDVWYCPAGPSVSMIAPGGLEDCDLLVDDLPPGERYSADHSRTGRILAVVNGEWPHGVRLEEPCRTLVFFPISENSFNNPWIGPDSCEVFDEWSGP
jgi:hypothetical protein